MDVSENNSIRKPDREFTPNKIGNLTIGSSISTGRLPRLIIEHVTSELAEHKISKPFSSLQNIFSADSR